jgi:hypothetical protein
MGKSTFCDNGPCFGLSRSMHLISTEMCGEKNSDLRATMTVVPAPDSPLQHREKIFLRYCPFCGVRFDEYLVHQIAKWRRT